MESNQNILYNLLLKILKAHLHLDLSIAPSVKIIKYLESLLIIDENNLQSCSICPIYGRITRASVSKYV